MFAQQSAGAAVGNSVVYGNFSNSSDGRFLTDKVNRTLMMILLLLVLISGISYYFVSDREKKMNNIGREIVSLTNENIELQNKIDNLHSFNKVDIAIHNKTMLDTAKQVIEIPAATSLTVPKFKNNSVHYNWSMGY